jgi:hypothetical protein
VKQPAANLVSRVLAIERSASLAALSLCRLTPYRNRAALALKERNTRKALFIGKHGGGAWLSRSWKKSGALERYPAAHAI